MQNELVELVKKLNEELYPDMDSDHRFGEVEYRSNYWCDSISIAGHCLWDCNHPGEDGKTVEDIVRAELREFCKFFGQAGYRIGDGR